MTLSLGFENSLEKGIMKFLSDDLLSGTDQYRCDKCKKSSKAKIQTELSKLPDVLTFHLKRFTYPIPKKIKGRCTYPAVLNMAEFSPEASEVDDSLKYELFGLTVHLGSLEMGHYIAYTKRYNKWYLFNDEHSHQVNESEALNQEVYLLFYKRVNSSL
jgi:ubiquitin C-terminal hydrolase